ILQELSAAGVDTTTGGMPGPGTPVLGAETPTPVLQGECRSPEAQVVGGSDATDGPPERVRSADASEATPPALASREAVRAVPDPTGRCPGCHATWEPGHERACLVQPEV